MSQFVSSSPVPVVPLWTRIMAAVDRALLSSAHIARRNGDLPYFGL